MAPFTRRAFIALPAVLAAQPGNPRMVPVGPGYAKNSVNSTIFCHPLVSDGQLQHIAWYDASGALMLGNRKLGSEEWSIVTTPFKGSLRDAHNGISLGVDGEGILHLAWNHHGDPLNYVRSVKPGSLELTGRLAMDGIAETRVTYPEFFPLADGRLLCLYRDGASGRGNTILKIYSPKSEEWKVVNHPLISGGKERNAYTNQIAVDGRGGWHISWCWREKGDVATNHDICYARSPDEGKTWRRSTGEPYALPITAGNAEVVVSIPQRSDLINQCTMTTDSHGQPLIASYWRTVGAAAPQYRVIWRDGADWRVRQVSNRTLDFRLGGGGTRRIPMSRPLIVVDEQDDAYLIFRDAERGSAVSVARAKPPYTDWKVSDLAPKSVGHWEPTMDAALWRENGELHLFHQRVGQGDGEKLEELSPQTVSVLEWRPNHR